MEISPKLTLVLMARTICSQKIYFNGNLPKRTFPSTFAWGFPFHSQGWSTSNSSLLCQCIVKQTGDEKENHQKKGYWPDAPPNSQLSAYSLIACMRAGSLPTFSNTTECSSESLASGLPTSLASTCLCRENEEPSKVLRAIERFSFERHKAKTNQKPS